MTAMTVVVPTQAAVASTVLLREAPPRPTVITEAASAGELCRLPVTGPTDNGFVTYPGAVFTPDPSGKPALPGSSPSSAPSPFGYAYDQAYSRWVPVTPALVSPDGSHYVLSLGDLHVVDVRTGLDSPLATSETAAWHAIGWQREGIYAIRVNTPGGDPGLWLVSYPDGTARQVSARGYWQAVSHGAAYGTLEAVPPPDTSYAIQRLDIASGAITRWFYLAGSRSPWVAGFDSSGAPVIEQSVDVFLVPAALQPRLISPDTKTTTAIGDQWGIWLGSNDGLFLYAGGKLARFSDLHALPVGSCVPSPAPAPGSSPDSSSRTYMVRAGDSLFSIARAFGLSSYWPLFWRNETRPQPNGGVLTDPSLIRPGWVLEIPTEPLRTYVVQPGDSLSLIAERFYGSGHGGWWHGVYDANRRTISNPALIHPGQALRIP